MDNKFKLLIFHPALAPYRVDQFNQLNRIFDLTVVFLFDNVWNHPFDQNVLVAKLNCRCQYLLKGPSYKGRVLRWGMLRLLRKERPDFVFGYEFSFTTQFLILMKCLGLLRASIGSTIDDSPEICRNVQTRLRGVARSLVIKQLDYLVVLSRAVADFYANSFGVTEEKIVIFPLLQDPATLRSHPRELEALADSYLRQWRLVGKKILLFIGRFIPEKGLPRFLETMAPMLRVSENLVLVLVGEGQEKNRLEALIESENLLGKVLLPGRSEGDALHAWYLCASGFVLPSVYEPFGVVVDEALIFGLPVFCSDRAGCAELAKRCGGWLFDPMCMEATQKALGEFLDTCEPVQCISLDQHPARVGFDRDEFENQWRKLPNGIHH